jgi:hypothetical protein
MGTRKLKRAKFFAEHPWCCFCGGGTVAATEDHVPSRAIFDSRKWPEGYNFPACNACNAVTRRDELIIAMMARIRNRDDHTNDEQQDREMRRAMDGVRNNFPNAYREMRVTANDVRRFLKNTGRERHASASLSDVPVIKVGDPEFLAAIRAFATKLMCALHYKHTGMVVPPKGVIASWFFSNVQVFDGQIPPNILSLVQGQPSLVRSKNDLHDQFSYQFALAAEKTTSVFLCSFRESFALIGLVSAADDLPQAFEEDAEHGKFRSSPFQHPVSV